jgi:DNA-binding CsgD family transcriptional regulator
MGPLPPGQSALELYARLTALGTVSTEPVDADDLAALESAGLARRTEGGLKVLAPFATIDAIVRAGAVAAARAREAAGLMEQAWQARPDREGAVEFVTGAESAAALAGIVAGSSALCAFNRRTSGTPVVVEGTFELLARGVSVRVVYDTGLLADEAALAAARACVAAGEQARVLPGVPVSMLIGDGVGCMSLPGSRGAIPDRVILRAPRLLTGLRDIFESLWDKAIPISASARGEADASRSEDDQLLLSLLSVGLTDHAIGRELGISERTVGRRVAQLQALLGARTRFQLGAQAFRQGWLSDL